ncbi:MAG: hypothetical protein IT582_04760 [Opitutaceae bacterium]|nr:hypothetical protein [Opitutaceae bacterium]
MLTGFVYTAAQGVDASDLMRAALQLAQAGDHPAALARMRDAAELRPTHPAYLYNLACLQSLAGEREAALATLQQLSGFGIYTPAAKDSDFASLADETAFQESTARFEANRAARGQVEAAFPLVHQSGLIEGLAWRAATDEWFFGDLHHRCVWRRATGGPPTRFAVEDAVSFGIGGLVVDEKRGLLWAAGSTQKVTSGWNEAIDGQCALLAFDLNTGALRHTYPVPNDGRVHATVDLTLATDGAVYLSDSAAPVIWRLVPGGGQLENWCEDARFRSLQGLALSTDGDTLYVADYALGLFRIAVASREIEALSARDTTLIGIDGLTRHGNALIAMQNGTNPFRVLRIEPDAQNAVANVTVLAAAQPAMVDPTLGVATDDAYFLIGQAGWDKFSAHKTQPQAHDCVVLRIGL